MAQGVSAAGEERRHIHTGVSALPDLEQDDSDRNRTSPFAFTGNKFEFRMLGSSQSIALTNVVLNTALAEVFGRFAGRLEAAENNEAAMAAIVADVLRDHGRVIFNGDNYSDAWVQEAKKRGLPGHQFNSGGVRLPDCAEKHCAL